jgi:copper(I)-binding protein
MKPSIKKINRTINRTIIMLLTLLFVQTAAYAQPIMIPGFMGIESSYMEAPMADSESTSAYFTIANLHYEPIVLLGASGDMFENAVFVGSDNEELEQVIIQPGGRLVMEPNGVHLKINDVEASSANEHFQELTLLVRRGLEPLDEVDEQRRDANNGQRGREAGVPNEHRFVVNVPLTN